MTFKGTNVKIYGNVVLGNNIIIEDNVIIGHPCPNEMRNLNLDSNASYSLDDLYDKYSVAKVIIGDSSIIRSGTIIYSGVVIGRFFNCGHNVLIRENTSIGDNVYFKPYADIQKNVVIGDNCRIGGLVADNVKIGNNVVSFGTLTHKVVFPSNEIIPAPIVKDNCIIGREAVLVGGVVIEESSTIGANTFVNFNVPPKSKVTGFKGVNRSLKDK